MNTTPVFSKILKAYSEKYRRIINKGGTSSSKTISTLQLLHQISERRTARNNPVSISVVSETLPHLKKGVIRDFEIILKKLNRYDLKNINQTDKIYYFGQSFIEFFSADSPGKVTGPRRNILYLNECNNIPLSIVKELEMRTDEVIFYDYNPVFPFWMDDHVLTLPESDFKLIESIYKDNTELSPAIIKEIEMRAARDPNFKRVHIDLQYGIYEGLIFPDIVLVDSMPGSEGGGMDFGFTNDPTTYVDVFRQGDNIYYDELLYQTGMTTTDIIRFLKGLNIGHSEIVADSADPRIIEEIRRAGFNIFGATKGKGSIVHGIDSMKRYKIHITKRSLNMIKEFRNYKWKEDSSGKMTGEPIDFWNHCTDAASYKTSKLTSKPALKKARFNF